MRAVGEIAEKCARTPIGPGLLNEAGDTPPAVGQREVPSVARPSSVSKLSLERFLQKENPCRHGSHKHWEHTKTNMSKSEAAGHTKASVLGKDSPDVGEKHDHH